MIACFNNGTGDSEAAEKSPDVVIAFKASELKDVIWVTPAILTKNYEDNDDFDTRLQIMIFDGDELIIHLPEAGQYKFKWELGGKGQIKLKDLDPESSPGIYEIWKLKEELDSKIITISNDYFSPVGQTEEQIFIKPRLLNASELSSKSITTDKGRVFGIFEGSQYKYNIYENDSLNFYGEVSDDQFQNTVLVKTDHSADRYMLFEGIKPELGTLLKFSYWRVHAEQPPIELGGIYRIKNLTQEDYHYEPRRSRVGEPYYAAHSYK